MIIITNKKLLESVGALRELANLDVPVRTSLKLRKMLRVTQQEIDDWRESHKGLVEKHCKKGEDGKPTHPENPRTGKPDPARFDLEESREAFERDLEELNAVEVKLDFLKVKPEDLGDVKVKGSVALQLDWLIEDFEE